MNFVTAKAELAVFRSAKRSKAEICSQNALLLSAWDCARTAKSK